MTQAISGFTISSAPRHRVLRIMGVILAMTTVVARAPRAWAATYTWGSATTGGSWSTSANWSPNGVPAAADTAILDDAAATRTVFYDAAATGTFASGTVAALSITQSSGFVNTLELQRTLSITAPVALAAATGTARVSVVNSSTSPTLVVPGGITLSSGGVLSLGATNPSGSTIYSAFVTGSVGVAGGLIDASLIQKAGSATGAVFSQISGPLSMTSGTIAISNTSTYTDRRFTVTGNASLTGGAVTTTVAGSRLDLRGADNTLTPASFAPGISVGLQATGSQSLLTGVSFGNQFILSGNNAVKTVTASAPGVSIGSVVLQDSDGTTPGSRTTLKLGSNLSTGTSQLPYVISFSNVGESGRVDVGIDADRYTLDMSTTSGTWLPNYTSQAGITNTVWTLSGTAGTIKATAFNFSSSGTGGSATTNVGPGLVLNAVGGNGTGSILSGTGTIDPSSVFRYSGTASPAIPATLGANRPVGDVEVTSGALRISYFSVGQVLRVSGGATADLGGGARSFAGGQLVDGSVINGTLSGGTAGVTVQSGTVSAAISGATLVTKTGSGTVVLSAANNYTGGTTLSGGTLALSGGNNRLPTSGTVTLGGTSTLAINAVSQSVATLTTSDASSATAINGGGSLTVTGSPLQFGVTGGTTGSFTTTVDMTGLSSFTYGNAAGAMRVGLKSAGSANQVDTLSVVTLAGSNAITAAQLAVSDVSGATTGGTARLHLGATNMINVNAINTGLIRANGTIDFAAAGGTATFRAADGTSAIPSWTVGSVGTFQSGTFTATNDFRSGTIDAAVDTLTIGKADVGNAANRAGTIDAAFAMGPGSLTSGTVLVGVIASSGSGGVAAGTTYASRGTFALDGGLVEASSIVLATNTITSTSGTRSVSGTLNLVSGTVRATTLGLGSQAAGTATASAAMNWTNGALENRSGGDLTVTGLPITLAAGTHTFNAVGGRITLDASSPLSGPGGIVKAGDGGLVLSSSNGYFGDTVVTTGTLALATGASITNSSAVSVAAGSTFDVSALAGGFTVGTAQAIGGAGTVSGGLAIGTDGTVSPGETVGTSIGEMIGTLATTQILSLQPGGNYNFQLTSGTGTPGIDWDLLTVGGGLAVQATTASPFEINLWSLAGSGSGGAIAGFDPTRSYSWRIASAAGGLSGFAAGKFHVNTAPVNGTGGFANDLAGGGFSVAQSGNDLNLVFTAGGGVITISVASGTQTQTQAGYPLLAGTTPVIKAGGGTLLVDQVNTLTGSTTVQAGVLKLANGAALVSSRVVPLAGGTVALSSALQTTVGGLTPSAGGLVDVGNGMVTVAAGLSAADMVTAIVTGMGDGSWNGTSGITSSAAAASGGDRTIGWLDNGDGTVTFAFAAAGDTNLDWQVDIIDAANFLAGGKFDTGSPASWNEGDFTYDGVVDILDAASFLSNGLFDAGPYNAASLGQPAVAAVPEPSVWALLAAGGMTIAIRRRRR